MADHSLSDHTDINAIAEHIDYDGSDDGDSLDGDESAADGDDDAMGFGNSALHGEGAAVGFGNAALHGDSWHGGTSGGNAALWGAKGVLADLSMKEAQDAIRELLIYVRDGRLKAGVPALRAVHADDIVSGAQVAHVVSVDTAQSAAQRKASPKKSDFEDAIDDLVNDKEDEEDAILGGEDDDDDEIEPIDLRFKRPDHDHNIHAWKQGDDINVSMRVLKADGQPRVITGTASHEAEMVKIIECFKQLGYTPDKILRLPLDELASRIGASSIIAPIAKNAGAILGLDGRKAHAPYVCGLVR